MARGHLTLNYTKFFIQCRRKSVRQIGNRTMVAIKHDTTPEMQRHRLLEVPLAGVTRAIVWRFWCLSCETDQKLNTGRNIYAWYRSPKVADCKVHRSEVCFILSGTALISNTSIDIKLNIVLSYQYLCLWPRHKHASILFKSSSGWSEYLTTDGLKTGW